MYSKFSVQSCDSLKVFFQMKRLKTVTVRFIDCSETSSIELCFGSELCWPAHFYKQRVIF